MVSTVSYRYRAFISYSQKEPDGRWAANLHTWLERYRIPFDLARRLGQSGRRRDFRGTIFRDRDELPAGRDLDDKLKETLRESEFLIVVCSANSAQSAFVNAETGHFKSLGRSKNILPIIQPRYVGRTPECFPIALTRVCDAQGHPTGAAEAPTVAADARPDRDGEERAKQKLVAGLLGVNLGEIVDRFERHRRQERVVLGGLVVLFAGLASIAGYQWANANLAEATAESNLRVALASVDVLANSTTDLTQRYAIPQGQVQSLLGKADSTLAGLKGNGSLLQWAQQYISPSPGGSGAIQNSDDLRFHKATLAILLAESYSKQAKVGSQLSNAKLAVELLEPLVNSDHPDMAYVDAIVNARYSYAQALSAVSQKGDSNKQVAAGIRQADPAMQSPQVPDTLRLNAARLHIQNGQLLFDGDKKQAQDEAEAGLRLLDSLAEFGTLPANVQESLSWAYVTGADLLRRLGFKDKALETINLALAKLAPFLADQPRSYEGRRAKANLLGALGDSTRLEPRTINNRPNPDWLPAQQRSLESYRSSLEIRQQLKQDDPADASLLLGIALMHGKIAEQENVLKNYICSYVEAELAKASYADLIQKHPDWNLPKAFYDYSLDPLVDALIGLGKYDSALQAARDRAENLRNRGAILGQRTTTSNVYAKVLTDVAKLTDITSLANDRGRR